MKVTEAYAGRGPRPLIACDFSPPRSGDIAFVGQAADLTADFICVAYNPGRSVRLGSMAAAVIIQRDSGRRTIFNLATRDMNKLALQTRLLEAEALGLENVLVLQGDVFPERDLRLLKAVNDYTPTDLLIAIKDMNIGRDFRGAALAAPTGLCAGAAADLGRPLADEARLVAGKVAAGAQFLITQGVYDNARVREFHALYEQATGGTLSVPVFYGVAVLVKGGVLFGDVPERVRRELDGGRTGKEIALEIVADLRANGCSAFYIMPPVQRGGARDYIAAQEVIASIQAS